MANFRKILANFAQNDLVTLDDGRNFVNKTRESFVDFDGNFLLTFSYSFTCPAVQTFQKMLQEKKIKILKSLLEERFDYE